MTKKEVHLNGNVEFDSIIIGGGLAGLTAAIGLRNFGVSVLLIEKHDFPRHKVCGEYVSNEVLPILEAFGLDPFSWGAVAIEQFRLVNQGGQWAEWTLPLGGFGISRHRLDEELYKEAQRRGVKFLLNEEVVAVAKEGFQTMVKTRSKAEFHAELVLGTYGKRSVLDSSKRSLDKRKKAAYVGVKAHYRGDFDSRLVGIYNFEGGYCGVSKNEMGLLNICYLANYESFKRFRKLDDFEQEVLGKNPELKQVLNGSELAWEKRLAISQFHFEQNPLVQGQLLMAGDSASMIHPLCGNGMGMAMVSARILTQLIAEHYLTGVGLTSSNAEKDKRRRAVERAYERCWKETFSKRLRTGKALAFLMDRPLLLDLAVPLVKTFPAIGEKITSLTHGAKAGPGQGQALISH